MPPKAALTAVRALKDKPEAVHPARHGLLWRVAKIIRTWEQRWFCLDHQGFVYSKSPQGLSLAKPVFGSHATVQRATAEDQMQSKVGTTMWGFTVVSDTNDSVTLYAEQKSARDQWVCSLNMAAQAFKMVQHLDHRFMVDYDKPLGTGLFAVVLRGLEVATQMPVAVKVIKADAYREYKDLVDREVMVWHAVGSHPNIVKLHEVLFSSTRVYFVAELLSGGDLVTHLAQARSYTEADVARVVQQILQAVKHCHAQGLVHMDLKPENLVLQDRSVDSQLKLIDFSLASFFNTSTEPGGTPEFVAPELLCDPELYAEQGCGPSIDIWALGVITFYLLCGTTPFTADTLEDIIRLVKGGRWEFEPLEAWASISPAAKDLVASMLRLDPHARPTAQQLLSHAWLTAAPQQHKPAQLAHAQAAFKAQSSGKLSEKEHLRTSWINRTGVMRGGLLGCTSDANNSNGQLAAMANLGSQAPVGSAAAPATSVPACNTMPPAAFHHGHGQMIAQMQPSWAATTGSMAYPTVAAATAAVSAVAATGQSMSQAQATYPAVSPHTTGHGLAGHPVLMRPQDVLAAKQGIRVGNSIDILATSHIMQEPQQQQQQQRVMQSSAGSAGQHEQAVPVNCAVGAQGQSISNQAGENAQSKKQQLAMLQAQLDSLLKLKAQREAAAAQQLQQHQPQQHQTAGAAAHQDQSCAGQAGAGVQPPCATPEASSACLQGTASKSPHADHRLAAGTQQVPLAVLPHTNHAPGAAHGSVTNSAEQAVLLQQAHLQEQRHLSPADGGHKTHQQQQQNASQPTQQPGMQEVGSDEMALETAGPAAGSQYAAVSDDALIESRKSSNNRQERKRMPSGGVAASTCMTVTADAAETDASGSPAAGAAVVTLAEEVPTPPAPLSALDAAPDRSVDSPADAESAQQQPEVRKSSTTSSVPTVFWMPAASARSSTQGAAAGKLMVGAPQAGDQLKPTASWQMQQLSGGAPQIQAATHEQGL